MREFSRLGALVAASALSLAGVAVVAAPADASTEARPITQGVTWVEGQLVDGVLPGDYGPLYGPSIDLAISLAELGGHAPTVTTIATAVRNHYYDYVTGGDYGPDDFYAGPVAKALVLAQVAGTKPTSYSSGVQSELESLVVSSGANTGRIKNSGPYPDSNVISQTLAARSLAVAGSSKAADVEAFLLEQQCAAGFFREGFSPEADSDQTCDAASGKASLDTTAIAVLNLSAIPTPDAGVVAAITAAKAWLAAHQNPDGSWGLDNSGQPVPNANATGLSARALGGSPASVDGANWLRDHQANDTDACTRLAGDIGAIAFDDAALADGRSAGIGASSSQQWRLVAAQVLPALQYASAAAPASLTVSGPLGYRQAGTPATYKVAGAASGGRLCTKVGSNYRLATAVAGGPTTVVVTLPGGSATRPVTVTDRDGNTATTSTKVLGATTLKVTPAARRVHRGKAVTVTISRLAPGEVVTLRYRGAVVATGKATSVGTFVRSVRVGTRLGAATVAAYGQFPTIRKGASSITVIR